MRSLKIPTVIGLSIGLLALFAPVAGAKTIKGTVVHQNKANRTYVVSDRTGRLSTIHSRKRVRTGRRVLVRTRKLRNGTFAQKSVRLGRLRSKAKVRGTVTFRSASHDSFVVSNNGTSMAIEEDAALPDPGTIVEVDVDIDDDGNLKADDIDEKGDDHVIEIEGIVLAVDVAARSLSISAEDCDDKLGAVLLHLPETIDPAAFTKGDDVEFEAVLNPDGSYTATGAWENDGAEEADGDNHQHGEHEDEDDHEDSSDDHDDRRPSQQSDDD